jgi:hypothetical protein
MPRKESPNIEAVRVYAARRSMLHVWEKTTRFSVYQQRLSADQCESVDVPRRKAQDGPC